MKRWLCLALLTGCVGGLESTLRLGQHDAGADEEPAASRVLDAGLDARVVPDGTDAALDADVRD